MKKLIVLLITLALLPQVFADTLSYSVIINYDNETLSLKDILLIKASPMPADKTGEYTTRIVSFKGDLLFETNFNINLDPLYSMPLSKETATSSKRLTKTSFDLVLPYYSNAKIIKILKENKLLLEIDLSRFSACNENHVCDGAESVSSCPGDCTCGNNICDANENYMKCSSDCHSGQKDNVCDKIADGICDPDCNNKDDYDCKATSGSKLFLYAGVIAIAIVLILILAKKIKKSNRNKNKAAFKM